jgi:hypothetical protein
MPWEFGEIAIPENISPLQESKFQKLREKLRLLERANNRVVIEWELRNMKRFPKLYKEKNPLVVAIGQYLTFDRIIWVMANFDKLKPYMPSKWLEYLVMVIDYVGEKLKDYYKF